MQQTHASYDGGIPPIVLIVDADRDALGLYSACFESAGMWVATSTQPIEALDAVRELKPDLIVTHLRKEPNADGLVHALKANETTRGIPVIVLSDSDSDSNNDREADLVLRGPTAPLTLLARARALLDYSQELRERSERATIKTSEFVQRSPHLVDRATSIVQRVEAGSRTCPVCRGPLEWIESGRIAGATYDYYRWCWQGCGLYCYDQNAESWVKLA